jgi:flagellar motor switch/type III secretory pathway protein FliN
MNVLTTPVQGPISVAVPPSGVSAVEWEEFDGSPAIAPTSPPRTFTSETLNLRMTFGHTQVRHDETERLRSGAVVPLDDAAREPVAIHADGQLIGWGEVLAVDGKLAIRVVELAPAAVEN